MNHTPDTYRVLLWLGTVENDDEIIECLLWENTGERLLRYSTGGCYCCGIANDVDFSEATPTTLEAAADELWSFWEEHYTGQDATETARELTDAFVQAHALTGTPADLV